MALLSAFSEHAPAMMADVLDELASLIAFPATAITDSALRCVSRCCAAGVALERAPTEVLRSLCESGSVAQATSAAEILSSSREDDVLRDVVRLALNMDAPESAPVLSACAHIARNRMDLFQEADPDDRLVQRVQNEVFTSDGRHLGPAKAAGRHYRYRFPMPSASNPSPMQGCGSSQTICWDLGRTGTLGPCFDC